MPAAGGKRSLATRLAWSAHVARRAPFEPSFPFLGQERIERRQGARLRATIEHAHEHVPYYRETMRKLGLAPSDFQSAGDLARLPLLDRERVQSDPEYFLSRAEPQAAYVELRSGGSTGDPLSLLYHPFTLFEQAVYSERARSVISKLVGRRRFKEARVARVPGSPSGGPNVAKAFRSLSLLPAALRVRRRDFSAVAPLEQLVEEFDAYRPDVIGSFGSFHEALFAYLRRTGRTMHLPKVVVYAGDGMSESAREIAERQFGVVPMSVYTASEAFQIGFECERHVGHHLNVDLFPIRVVSPDGAELPPGEQGEVVVSNLQARGTILLNYRLNDVATRLPEPCGCGRTLPLLSLVQGRSDEWLEDTQGRQIHSQAVRGFFQNELEVLRFQVTQESRTAFRAALVTTPESDQGALATRLQTNFSETFGEQVRLEVSFVDSLPRTPAGKVRPVIALPR